MDFKVPLSISMSCHAGHILICAVQHVLRFHNLLYLILVDVTLFISIAQLGFSHSCFLLDIIKPGQEWDEKEKWMEARQVAYGHVGFMC